MKMVTSVMLCLIFICAVCPAAAAPPFIDKQPLIVSYFWPVEKESRDFYHLNMLTPNVIDIQAGEVHGDAKVRAYWTEKGKLLLNRVNPLKFKGGEEELYAYFATNMDKAKGISVDELLSGRTSQDKIINVLRRTKKAYPEKYIFIWGSPVWNESSIPLLRAIRDYGDVFMPELYISEADRLRHGLGIFNDRLHAMEAQAPGILKKTIIGIGVYPKMLATMQGSVREHVAAQIEYIKSDPFLSQFQGLAIYAPYYLSIEDQKYLDELIRRYYF